MWGSWVAQLVEHRTLDFKSGHDFKVERSSPCVGLCTLGGVYFSPLSPSASASPPTQVHAFSFSQINKYLNLKKKRLLPQTIGEPHGNYKAKTLVKTQNRKRKNISVPLKKVIKPHTHKKSIRQETKPIKIARKHITKWQ